MSLIKVPDNPIELFAEWFAEAERTNIINPNASALATATKKGKPSVRMILIKAFDERGFVFYSHLKSRKAKELTENPQAALCSYWALLAKQVRIEGKVEQVDSKEADDYFASRERESKIVAWATDQSQMMKSFDELHQRVEKYTDKFKGGEVPRPEFWSGYRLIPDLFEFWKSGEHRLHERICYKKNEKGQWFHFYLYP